MKPSRILHLTLCGLAALLGGCAGMVSTALPPALTSSQAQRLRELPLPYSVGVARDPIPVYSEHLTKALTSSGVFRRVAPFKSFSRPPDLIATVEERIHGSTNFPVLTILSAGVVPTAAREEHGFIFSLAPTSDPKSETVVDAHYRGMTTLGWAALGFTAFPNYTSGDQEETQRFRDFLAYRILVALRPYPASNQRKAGH